MRRSWRLEKYPAVQEKRTDDRTVERILSILPILAPTRDQFAAGSLGDHLQPANNPVTFESNAKFT
jgi:hypothetical protein